MSKLNTEQLMRLNAVRKASAMVMETTSTKKQIELLEHARLWILQTQQELKTS